MPQSTKKRQRLRKSSFIEHEAHDPNDDSKDNGDLDKYDMNDGFVVSNDYEDSEPSTARPKRRKLTRAISTMDDDDDDVDVDQLIAEAEQEFEQQQQEQQQRPSGMNQQHNDVKMNAFGLPLQSRQQGDDRKGSSANDIPAMRRIPQSQEPNDDNDNDNDDNDNDDRKASPAIRHISPRQERKNDNDDRRRSPVIRHAFQPEIFDASDFDEEDMVADDGDSESGIACSESGEKSYGNYLLSLKDPEIVDRVKEVLYDTDDLEMCLSDESTNLHKECAHIHRGGLPCPGLYDPSSYSALCYFDKNWERYPALLLYFMVMSTFFSRRSTGSMHAYSDVRIVHDQFHNILTPEMDALNNVDVSSTCPDVDGLQGTQRSVFNSLFKSMAAICCVLSWDGRIPPFPVGRSSANHDRDVNNLLNLLEQIIYPECIVTYEPIHERSRLLQTYQCYILQSPAILGFADVRHEDIGDEKAESMMPVRVHQRVATIVADAKSRIIKATLTNEKHRDEYLLRVTKLDHRLSTIAWLNTQQSTVDLESKCRPDIYEIYAEIILARLQQKGVMVKKSEGALIMSFEKIVNCDGKEIHTYTYPDNDSLETIIGKLPNNTSEEYSRLYSNCDTKLAKRIKSHPTQSTEIRFFDPTFLHKYRLISYRNGIMDCHTGLFYYHRKYLKYHPIMAQELKEVQWPDEMYSDDIINDPKMFCMQFIDKDYEYLNVLRHHFKRILFLEMLYCYQNDDELPDIARDFIEDYCETLDGTELFLSYVDDDDDDDDGDDDTKEEYKNFRTFRIRKSSRIQFQDILQYVMDDPWFRSGIRELERIVDTKLLPNMPKSLYRDQKTFRWLDPTANYVKVVAKMYSDQDWTIHTTYDEYMSNGRALSGVLQKTVSKESKSYQKLCRLLNKEIIDDRQFIRYVYGAAKCGKSTTADWLCHFVEDDLAGTFGTKSRSSTMEQFSTVVSKAFIMASEFGLASDKRTAIESLDIKKFASQDKFVHDRMRTGSLQLRLYSHIIIKSNSETFFDDEEGSTARRMSIAYTPNQIRPEHMNIPGEQGKDLKSVFQREQDYFLFNCLMANIHHLARCGNKTYQDVDPDPDSVRETIKFRQKTDPCGFYIEENIKEHSLAIGDKQDNSRRYITDINHIMKKAELWCNEVSCDKFSIETLRKKLFKRGAVQISPTVFLHVRFEEISKHMDESEYKNMAYRFKANKHIAENKAEMTDAEKTEEGIRQFTVGEMSRNEILQNAAQAVGVDFNQDIAQENNHQQPLPQQQQSGGSNILQQMNVAVHRRNQQNRQYDIE